MNYFAHGRAYVDDPYRMAGTAVPDWLSVVDRRVRVRRKQAAEFLADPHPHLAAMAAGVVQHHVDDNWFHATLAFTELNWQLSALVRQAVGDDDSFRPSFLGHILIELLLDAELIAADPSRLEAYYQALARLDPAEVTAAVEQMSGRGVPRLAELLPLFIRERFLWDYLADDKLCYRLNQVLARVGLARLPAEFAAALPEARRKVRERQVELLTPPASGDSNSVRATASTAPDARSDPQ